MIIIFINIFIVKFKNFTPEVEIVELEKEQDFSKSKNLHKSIELRDFWGVQIRRGGGGGGEIFYLSSISICNYYRVSDILKLGVKFPRWRTQLLTSKIQFLCISISETLLQMNLKR